MKARWVFTELSAEDLKQILALGVTSEMPKVGVEFLSVNIEFNNCIEMCWNWYHNDHVVIQNLIYSSAVGEIEMDELLEELGGFDGNYQTTKSERMEALKLLIALNTEIQVVSEQVGVMPFWPDNKESKDEVAVGQIRSIEFINEDGDLDRRFVLVTSVTDSDVVQVMLVGSFDCAGKNDVFLYEAEKPSLEADSLQTDLRFPVMRSQLGAVYSTIYSETQEILHKMSNYSGRDVSRKGLLDESNWMRQDYIREEMSAVKHISQTKGGE